jgi:SAM-dependent methyltransferase
MQKISLAEIQQQLTVLQVVERFFDSAVLFALFESGVFAELATGPKAFREIQASIKGDPRSLRAALDAAVALKLLSKENDCYAGSEAVLDCLGRTTSPAYLGEWVAFLHALAGPLLKLGEVIRTGIAPGTYFEDCEGDDAPARKMTAAMDAFARTRGIEMVDRLDFSQTRRLLDLGCGPGTYSMAIVERNPHVRATLLDLPGPIAEARQLAIERKITEHLEFIDVDARRYKPEVPFDTVLVSNVLHLVGPEDSPGLLKGCYDFLAPGGRVIVQAQFLNDERTSPRWPTLLNLTQCVASERGQNHAITETTQWMEQAGFRNIRHVRFSLWNVNSCLIGERSVER